MLKGTPLEILYVRFPWAKNIIPEFGPDDEYSFYDEEPINFNRLQLKLIECMFWEIENWFISRGKPVEVAVYRVSEVFNRLHVEIIGGVPEILSIVEKYELISEKVF